MFILLIRFSLLIKARFTRNKSIEPFVEVPTRRGIELVFSRVQLKVSPSKAHAAKLFRSVYPIN